MTQGLASEGSGVRRVGCSSHCRACGLHFSSDGAFDAHRAGPMDERYCVDVHEERDRAGRLRFIERATDGFCGVVHTEDVTVWTLRQNMEGAERLRELRAAA